MEIAFFEKLLEVEVRNRKPVEVKGRDVANRLMSDLRMRLPRILNTGALVVFDL